MRAPLPRRVPCTAASRRKKDHGRAESLLIAAWASGIAVPDHAFDAAFSALGGASPHDGAAPAAAPQGEPVAALEQLAVAV